MDIASIKRVLAEIPAHVTVVAAVKKRTPEEVAAAIECGISNFGHNYVQEAERMIGTLGRNVTWHFIGALQTNKAGKAARLFDMVQTVDSLRSAIALDTHCAAAGRTMPVLIEINSAAEPQKSGVPPEEAEVLARELVQLSHIRLVGLMTMGPAYGSPEDARSCFRTAKIVFERLRDADIANASLSHLSMGMSDTYKTAIEEGATMVRLGTVLFGRRT